MAGRCEVLDLSSTPIGWDLPFVWDARDCEEEPCLVVTRKARPPDEDFTQVVGYECPAELSAGAAVVLPSGSPRGCCNRRAPLG